MRPDLNSRPISFNEKYFYSKTARQLNISTGIFFTVKTMLLKLFNFMYFGFAFGVCLYNCLYLNKRNCIVVVDEMKSSRLKFRIAFYLP